MGCFGPDAPKERNYADETWQTLKAKLDYAPAVYESEARFQPLYADLNLQNLNRYMFGSGNATGYLNMYQKALPMLSAAQNAANATQRSGDIADVERLGRRATAALLGSNPFQQALLNRLNGQAQNELDLGSRLDPITLDEIRRGIAEQRGAAGWGMDPADLAQEAMATGQAAEARKMARRQFAGQVLQANQTVIGDPFAMILGKASNLNAQAPGMFGQGQQGTSNLGPGMFNPESAYAAKLYSQNSEQDANWRLKSPSTFTKVMDVGNAVDGFVKGLGKSFF